MSLAQLTLDNLESSLPLPGPSHLILYMETYIADCNANFHHWSLASSIVMPLFSSFLSISCHCWSSHNLTWTSPIYTKAFSHRLLSINESNLFGLPFQGRHFSMWPQIFHILCNMPLRQIKLIAISWMCPVFSYLHLYVYLLRWFLLLDKPLCFMHRFPLMKC